MRSLRLTAAALALGLIVLGCGGDDDEEPVADNTTTTTEPTPSTVVDEPAATEPTAPPDPAVSSTTTTITINATPTTAPAEPGDETVVAPPEPPSNVKCIGGSAEGELLVEFDALSDPENVSKIRVYVEPEGGVPTLNGEYALGEIDTSRAGGTRWAAPARGVPANVALRVTATSFNQLGQESGWYLVPGYYVGPGQPCGEGVPPTLPPPTCTAGCDEESETEPSP